MTEPLITVTADKLRQASEVLIWLSDQLHQKGRYEQSLDVSLVASICVHWAQRPDLWPARDAHG